MMTRMWSGSVPNAKADEYFEYLQRTGLSDYRATPGNQGVWVLRRDQGEVTEFLLISLWDSLESIRAFAGDDLNRAVYYPEDEAFLLEQKPSVDHYEVVVALMPE